MHIERRAAPPSIKDIAKRAGVSESTVSRALNNNPRISAETRRRIKNLAHEMDYSVNASARNLRLQRSQAVSVVINSDDVGTQKLSDPFMMVLISAVADELHSHGYSLVFSSPSIARHEWRAQLLGSMRSDGIIVIGQGKNDQLLRKMRDKGDPLVVWGSVLEGNNYCVVGSDNYRGGELAAEHLIQRGCQQILFLGDTAYPEICARFRGYADTLQKSDLLRVGHQARAAFSIDSGAALVARLLRQKMRFDGIFAASDHIAMGAIKALQTHGLRVPEDVAVVGFDDIAIAPFFAPPLTTVRQDVALGGKLLAKKILAVVNGKAAVSEVLAPKLIVRASS